MATTIISDDSYLFIYDASTGYLDDKYSSDIDRLGLASGQAQHLNQAITSVSKLSGTNHTIILSVSTSSDTDDKKSFKCNGFIKYGTKNLYFYKKDGSIKQSNPICLLDFYVDESMQRHGIGLTLFQKMIELCSIDPAKLAYDRPSPKLISFMRKHFNLTNPELQPNRFAIFCGFPL